MPGNEKKNGLLSLFKGVFKSKKEECADIVTQAETVISDYVSKRRNEIINKYYGGSSMVPAFVITASCLVLLAMVYILLFR